MSFDRTKLVLSFALIGFLVGSSGYFLLNWILVNSTPGILYVPVPIFAPWFLSGIAGSLLSVIAIYIFANFSQK